MAYLLHGLSSFHDIVGDFIVYRNLAPADRRLPALADLRAGLGLANNAVPRKSEPNYGRVVAEILRRARELDRPGSTIKELIFIGDTLLLDGTAFANICAAGRWPGWAFIGKDVLSSSHQTQVEEQTYISNRWAALPDFLNFVQARGFALDEQTAAVIDMDKTAIGARGRNDKVIDEARVEGVHRTVADLLGPQFDAAAFRSAYDLLNQPIYHPFTADNQDYLAYICLVLGAGLFELNALVADVRSGKMPGFAQFIAQVQARRTGLPPGLFAIHDAVWQCVQAGDPTPFKAFRYNEYLTTASRFGNLPGATIDDVLKRRIVITHEVHEAARILRGRGVLIFGLSDKPDEASYPSEEQASTGMKPLHQLETPAVEMEKE